MAVITVPPAQALATYLALKITHPSDWKCFVGAEPDMPDSVITVFDTTGVTDGRDMRTKESIVFHGVQVRLRSVVYSDGWGKLQEIKKTLDRVQMETVRVGNTAVVLHAFKLSGTPSFIGRTEKNRRCIFTLNGLLTATEV
jgi:hypothetical protein